MKENRNPTIKVSHSQLAASLRLQKHTNPSFGKIWLLKSINQRCSNPFAEGRSRQCSQLTVCLQSCKRQYRVTATLIFNLHVVFVKVYKKKATEWFRSKKCISLRKSRCLLHLNFLEFVNHYTINFFFISMFFYFSTSLYIWLLFSSFFFFFFFYIFLARCLHKFLLKYGGQSS